jgi:DNA sulfur modification protein DndD
MSSLSSLKISNITIKNYRTYYGEKPPIEISTDSKKPVTVIHGISGRGKTSLLNAIHWCIYGKEKNDVKQKKETSEGLVHSYALDTLEVGKEENMFVRVIMVDEDDRIVFEIEREIIFKKINSNDDEGWNDDIQAVIPTSIQTETKATFGFRDIDTDELVRIQSLDGIKDRLEVIFPEILSSYVLFDAELLRQFEEQNEDKLVKKGIETITGLPLINSAIKNIEKENRKTTNSNVSEKAEFKSLGNNIERLEKEIDSKEKENKKYQEKYDANLKEIKEITTFLIKNDDEAISKREEEIKIRDKEIKDLGNNVDNTKHEMSRTIFENLSNYYLRKSFLKVNERFEKWTEQGLIPSRFTKEALQSLLDDKMCVCERPLGEHEEDHREKIAKAIQKVYEAAMGTEIGKIRASIENILEDTDDQNSPLRKEEYNKNKTDLAKYRTARSAKTSENKKAKEDYDPNIHDKNTVKQIRRSKLEKENDKNKTEISGNELKLKIYKDKLKISMHEYARFKKVEVKDTFAKNKINLADYAEKILRQSSETLFKDFKDKVEKTTQEYFLEIAPQKEEFYGVEIDDESFAIRTLRAKDKEKTPSQGQAHSLGLAYISGIRSVMKQNYFMMIDSPFHNISQESKLLACVDLPTKLGSTQITFFCTNTEYRGKIEEDELSEEIDSARNVLKENNLLGAEYNLADSVLAEINGQKYRDTNVVRIPT